MKHSVRNVLFGGPGSTTAAGDLGLAILRIGVGLMLGLGHGLGKIWTNGHIGVPEQLVGGVAKMGFPAPTFFAWMSVLAELLGGLLLAQGLLTRPAAFFMAFNMAVAAFVAHKGAPIVSGGGVSKEPALLYLLPSLCFMLVGAGRYSVDHLIRGSGGPRGASVSH
jgi:putative oxidoreductase